MKLDTYFQRDGETGRATIIEEIKEDRARMGVFGWMFGSFAFAFAVVTVWAVA